MKNKLLWIVGIVLVITLLFLAMQSESFWYVIIIILDRIFWFFELLIKNWIISLLIIILIGLAIFFIKSHRKKRK